MHLKNRLTRLYNVCRFFFGTSNSSCAHSISVTLSELCDVIIFKSLYANFIFGNDFSFIIGFDFSILIHDLVLYLDMTCYIYFFFFELSHTYNFYCFKCTSDSDVFCL